MPNEEKITELKQTVEKIREESGVNELQNKIEELEKKKDEYSDLRSEARDLIAEYLNQEVEMRKGRKSVADKITIRDGDVKNYGSSSSARISTLRNIVGDLVEETGSDRILDWLERAGPKYSELTKESKTLIDEEESEYDAVTVKVSGYSAGVKVVDALGSNGVCGGNKVDLDACCVEKLEPIIRHQPYMLEVAEEIEETLNSKINELESLVDEIEEEVE